MCTRTCTEISLWRYVYFELTRGYWLEHDKARFAERRKRVYTFMKIPRELEKVSICSLHSRLILTLCAMQIYVLLTYLFAYTAFCVPV